MTGRISQVVPAVLTDKPETLAALVRQAETFTNYVQFDIMDGQFVPSTSITWEHLSNLSMRLDWEAHLMVLHPEDYVENFKRAGAQKIVFHYEAAGSPLEVISKIKSLGLKAGLAINPETPVSAVLPLTSKLDGLLLMSVHPGFYGAKFIPEVLDKIAEFRSACPDLEIGIDGGIKESNISQIASRGADVIFVGSAIFLQPQPGESFRRLTAMARKGSMNRTKSG